MSFTVPAFVVPTSIYSGPWLARVLRVSLLANLAKGRRIPVNNNVQPQNSPELQLIYSLLLPPGTDVRDFSTSITPDVVECPSGSGRWYGVFSVDDVGKGFPNEYRCAQICKIYEALDPAAYPGLFWPTPIP